MDIDELCQLYEVIPPRRPKGSPDNFQRLLAINAFQRAASRLKLDFVKASRICQERRVATR